MERQLAYDDDLAADNDKRGGSRYRRREAGELTDRTSSGSRRVIMIAARINLARRRGEREGEDPSRIIQT